MQSRMGGHWSLLNDPSCGDCPAVTVPKCSKQSEKNNFSLESGSATGQLHCISCPFPTHQGQGLGWRWLRGSKSRSPGCACDPSTGGVDQIGSLGLPGQSKFSEILSVSEDKMESNLENYLALTSAFHTWHMWAHVSICHSHTEKKKGASPWPSQPSLLSSRDRSNVARGTWRTRQEDTVGHAAGPWLIEDACAHSSQQGPTLIPDTHSSHFLKTETLN